MTLKLTAVAAAAMIAASGFGGAAMATGAGTAPQGPSGSCPQPHPKCQLVNGQQVCTTQPAPPCTGGG
jgi:hypothetical protein